MSIATPITKLFGIKHPILLAGMNQAAGPELAAAVTNAGGLGVIGGVGYTPEYLRKIIHELKEDLKDKNAPFGVDLLLPQVGGQARATNYDYLKGKLDETVEIIIEEGAKLFVSAVGVPPKHVVERFHKAGIPVANIVGKPNQAQKALELGVDVIICQGGEGGGHTGDVPTSLLVPQCVDVCSKFKSPLTGETVPVVAAGGIYDGRGLAGSLAMGAAGVWVGTRFVCAEEAGAPPAHQKEIISAGYTDTIRTLIYTGRPLRVKKNPFIMNWEDNRQAEIKKLTSQGKLPVGMDVTDIEARPYLMGITAAAINDVKPAKQIVDEMVAQAAQLLQQTSGYLQVQSKL